MNIARYFLVPCIICCMVTSAAAQKTARKASTEETDKIFTKVEIDGGTNKQEWESYIKKSTVLPESVRKSIPPGAYKVQISFILDIHGKLSEIKADNDPGYELAERALRIFKDYKGLWQPANQCGRSVKSYKKMPVIFVVPAE
jgi:periplasmic protein TonB